MRAGGTRRQARSQAQCLHAASGAGAGEVWAREAHELVLELVPELVLELVLELSRRLTSSTSKPPCLIMRFT